MTGLAAGGEMLFLIEVKDSRGMTTFWTGAGWTFDARQAARYPHETAALDVASRICKAEVHPHIFA